MLAMFLSGKEPKAIAIVFGVTVWVIYKAIRRIQNEARRLPSN